MQSTQVIVSKTGPWWYMNRNFLPSHAVPKSISKPRFDSGPYQVFVSKIFNLVCERALLRSQESAEDFIEYVFIERTHSACRRDGAISLEINSRDQQKEGNLAFQEAQATSTVLLPRGELDGSKGELWMHVWRVGVNIPNFWNTFLDSTNKEKHCYSSYHFLHELQISM